MTIEGPTSRRVERLTIQVKIERILETGWLKVGDLRAFLRLLDEAEVADSDTAEVWWKTGPQDWEPPRIEVIKEVSINSRREP